MGEGKAAYEERRELERARRDAETARAKLHADRNDMANNVAELAMMALRDFLSGKAHLSIEPANIEGSKIVRFVRDE